ncbi:uncharacterized protein LOC143612469 [Bidens hawaiensis]|uniref:uncharacterized protein LOC143612469 n=1 Tax=Bidens hawaiensis TaxID=980011 RepID=UPI00404A7600
MTQFLEMQYLINRFLLSDANDQWVWSLQGGGVGNRLPTRTNLATKGIDIPSTICPLCNDGSETVIHVFGECASVKKIWDLIERWLNLKLPALRFPTDLMEWVENLALSVPKKEMVGAIIYVAWWAIWKLRNDTVFLKRRMKDALLFDEVTYFTFLWYSSRKSKCKANRIEWLKNPLLFM